MAKATKDIPDGFKPARSNRPKSESEILNRFWKGLKMREAKESLLVVPNQADVDNAVQKDPQHCALAQACSRLYDSRAIVIFQSVAYLDLPDDKGNRVLLRFTITKPTKDAIIKFDLTGEFPPGGFKFQAPTTSRKLEYMRTANKKRRVAIVDGKAVPQKGRHKTPRGKYHTMDGVRNGTGLVRFHNVKNNG